MKSSLKKSIRKSESILRNHRNLKKKSFYLMFIGSTLIFSLQTPVNDIFSPPEVNHYQRDNLLQLKINQWTPHAPIFVYGITNFTQTAVAESWSGDGTKANPYIIEGYNFTGAGELIVIQNTPLYFKIRDCFFNETSRLGSGIVIIDSSNGIIEDTMLFGSYYGIELIRSNYTLVQRNEITNQSVGIILNSSHGNNIHQNLIANNLNYGVSVINNSSYNTVAWNLWYENGGSTSEAFDTGINNIFVFNHWGALTTPDNDDDGIVDVPYFIDGVTNNRDKYPLEEQPPMYEFPIIHVILEPKILYPNGGENDLTGLITIQWLKGLDTKNHLLTYSLDYSTDSGITWSSIISGLTQTYFEWDLTSVYTNQNYKIRVTAICPEMLSKFDISDDSFSVLGLDPSPDTTTTSVPTTTTSIPTTTTNTSISTTSLIGSNIDPNVPGFIAICSMLLLFSLPIAYRKRDSIRAIITKSTGNSINDLLRERAISFDNLTEELQCKRLELPKRIKHDLGRKIGTSSLILRSGMIGLENIPPGGTTCQVCIGSLEGSTYFQCESCLRFVCLPHFVDLKKIDEEICPNCDGKLFLFPFTCEGCKLDYNQILDMESNFERCKVCGFPFPPQNHLILDKTKDISSAVSIDNRIDYSDDKNKKE